MLICRACSAEMPPGAPRCPRCGGESFSSANDLTDGVTVASATRAVAPGSGRASVTEVFTTGDLLAGRYRIVGLLGRGGMGEVYRADDLTLGQPVALKFLPRAVERHPDQLERMRAEVRITRQVSHPNVCRVYDLGSVDGRHFLTMEYIDGEDLASLLRRIGRLPADKALDIARQLCAALAAAHDRGVIHRDLKPANIMLDGRGKVRVTDFGLAIADDGSDRSAERAGTPAYMAPEQLNGAELSIKTDLYALGLVLYELFTGRRLFSANTIEQLRTLQSHTDRLKESASDVNLDPAVERVIVRCVEFDPAARPQSALAVAAALPGGDPLAAALAAGETPSPELVAAAADEGLFSAPVTAALLVVTIVGCLIAGFAVSRRSLFGILEPPFSADVLTVKAHELLERLRPGDPAVGGASSFDTDPAFGPYVMQHRELAGQWTDLARIRPGPVRFWVRASPALLAPRQFPGGGRVSTTDPPRVLPGMSLVITDERGRLTYLDAKPSADDERRPAAASMPWPQLFQEAGLEMTAFQPAAPEWLPLSWGDARSAWTGTAPHSSIPLRVEAAAYRGRPTFFVVAAPWTPMPGAPRVPTTAARTAFAIAILILIAIPIVAGILMARGSIRSGRADRRGAARFAGTVAAAQLTATWLVMAHAPGAVEVTLLLQALVVPLVTALIVWILYIGLEPFIRRTWPSALISWSRLIEGRIGDRRVARDILIGLAATGCLDAFEPLLGLVTPVPPRGLSESLWIAASGVREAVGAAISDAADAIMLSLVLLLLICLVRMLVRRDTVVTIAFASVVALTISGSYLAQFSVPSRAIFVIVYGAIYGAVWALLVMRFGLVTFMALQLADFLMSGVVTLNPSKWYAGSSLLNLTAIVVLAAFAAWASLAPRPSSVGVRSTASAGA
jgi:protein kinase-like protein